MSNFSSYNHKVSRPPEQPLAGLIAGPRKGGPPALPFCGVIDQPKARPGTRMKYALAFAKGQHAMAAARTRQAFIQPDYDNAVGRYRG